MTELVYCEDCERRGIKTRLSRFNEYFYPKDGIKRCTPCRQARWTPGTWPTKRIPMSHKEREAVSRERQREQVVAGALSPKVCECEHPIPMGDEEEADSCVRCAKRILRVPA